MPCFQLSHYLYKGLSVVAEYPRHGGEPRVRALARHLYKQKRTEAPVALDQRQRSHYSVAVPLWNECLLKGGVQTTWFIR